ncbi:hypothetical protein AZE42_12169 [Rhizopogon vesiculosus]|uniref:Uncharacterized protein n=1 Tax=Rhizopogon vesiculosus TaxID=180088 RepID=A0A1J8PTR6_9AGAM|nr:hypothetical protein AZE42_12169 [Rhizopogon vesiculosus]
MTSILSDSELTSPSITGRVGEDAGSLLVVEGDTAAVFGIQSTTLVRPFRALIQSYIIPFFCNIHNS